MADGETLRDRLLQLARYGERPAIIAFTGNERSSLSFAALAQQVQRLAAGLRARGVAEGETVAICGANRPEWVIAALGTILAGAVVTPLDPRLDQETLGAEIRRSGCRRLFVTGDLAETANALPDGRELEIWRLDDGEGDAGRSWRGLLSTEGGADIPAMAGDDVAALFFTSGTTGTPKEVPLTHRNLLSNVEALLDAGVISERERALLPLPLHHVYPFTVGMLSPLVGGASIVLPAGISGTEIQQALREGGATAVIGIPRLLEALLTAIELRTVKLGKPAAAIFNALLRASLWLRRRVGLRLGEVLFRPLRRRVAPELRFFASGGAPLDPDVAWRLEALGWEVLSGYGLTETSPIVSFNTRRANRIGTVGRPLTGVEIRIDRPDETGLGEILVRGPNLFHGYRDDPEATAEVFTADGWFRTKDLGRLENGFLTIGARVNETIVLGGGKKIFPETVEAAYLKSPLVHELAVLERNGRLVALVVPDLAELRRRGERDVRNAVAAELRQRAVALPPYQRITDFVVTRNPLPRTSLRKLRRHLLPEVFEQASGEAAPRTDDEALSDADRALLEAETARRAWEWLKRRYPDKPVTMDADLQGDLGIDSMDWTTLTLEIEDELGLRMGESSVTRAVSVRDLLEEILAAEQQGGVPAQVEATAEQKRWLDPPGPIVELLGALLFALNWAVMRLLFRLRVEHGERAPQAGPCILAPNHASFLDGFALAAAISLRQARQIYWAGFTGYLFQSPGQRLFSRIIHALPVDPARAPAAGLALGVEAVSRGKMLVWFPEGARTRDGRLQKLMPGIGTIVAETRAPVVPVHIAGTFEAWPIHRKWPRLHPVRVSFGEPVRLAGAASDPPGDAAERVTAALRERLARMATETGGEA